MDSADLLIPGKAGDFVTGIGRTRGWKTSVKKKARVKCDGARAAVEHAKDAALSIIKSTVFLSTLNR